MSVEAIREQIAAILASVEGMGVVHQYQRWTNDWKSLLDLFRHTDPDGVQRINGQMITRSATSQRKVTLGEKERAHIFMIRGVYSLKDENATEHAYQAILERAVDAFDEEENVTLNGTCLTTIPDWGPMADSAGLQIVLVEPRLFGSVLCHYSECRLCAIERVED